MGKTLGLDLGTNSIGWALIDKDRQHIIKTGVRIFPAGVENTATQKEESKNAKRRMSRQARRQTYRKRLRRIALLSALIDQGMCPLSQEDLKQWKNYSKAYPHRFPDTEAFTNWLALNPYELRYKALNEKISLEELGRIFYTFIHRRGFQTGRKSNEEGTLYKGKDSTKGINETSDALQNGTTLGEYLFNEYKQHKNNIRLRNRYTLRSWYIDEFERIWQKQAPQLGIDTITVRRTRKTYIGNPDTNRAKAKINQIKEKGIQYKVETGYLIREEKISLHDYLGAPKRGLLFYQRPLKSQKHLLAPCRFEANKNPCPLSHPDFEIFRALQVINNIQFGKNEFLRREDKEKLLQLLTKSSKAKNMKDVKKTLKMETGSFNYPDDFTIPGCPTISMLKPGFSNDLWQNQEQRHQIWHDFYSYDNEEMLCNRLISKYGLMRTNAERLVKSRLKEGYSNVSLRAIRNILPFLERGFQYSTAAFLGGVLNVCNRNNIELNKNIEQGVLDILHQQNKEGEAVEKVKTLLTSVYKLPEKEMRYLYHHSQSVRSEEYRRKLGAIENLRNPIVQQALNETRRLVNTIIDRYLEPDEQFESIRVELARDLKQSSEKRKKQYGENLKRKDENDKAREVLSSFGLSHTRQNIHKYLLYTELAQKNGTAMCPYSGKSISLNALFGPENLFQIEHIAPYSISLDDSLGNKTLCESNLNREKGEKTPYGFFHHNEALWREVISRAFACLPYNKAKRFISSNSSSEDFIERQLNDTRYISKKAAEILKTICPNVRVIPGRVTAELRHNWGLDTILAPPIPITEDLEPGEYWGRMDQEGSILSFHPKRSPLPEKQRDELLLVGTVKKNRLFSEVFPETYNPVCTEEDGKCWFKLHHSGLKEVRPIFKNPEASGKDAILLRGKKNKQQFEATNMSYPLLMTEDLPEGKSYWVEALITDKEKLDFIPANMQSREAKKNELKVFGTASNNQFIFTVFGNKYSLPALISDGKWIGYIPLKPDISNPIPVRNEKPAIKSGEICMEGTVESGFFQSDLNESFSTTESIKDPYPAWGVFTVETRPFEIQLMENSRPQKETEKLTEGKISRNYETGRLEFFPVKNRGDHRHHAIDALTVALTDQSFVQRLSTYNAQQKERQRGKASHPSFDSPWQDFRNQAVSSIEVIIVSHKKNNGIISRISKPYIKDGKRYQSRGIGVRGQLHKETVYGKRINPETGESSYRVRKSIDTISDHKLVNKIADSRIRKAIIALLETDGIDTSGPFKIPSGTLLREGKTRIFLPNRNGEPIPVYKVRMEEHIGNAVDLKTDGRQWVNPRNNHHILLYKNSDEKIMETCVTFWEAVQRKQKGEKVFQLPPEGKQTEAILKENEMFLIGTDSEQTINLSTYLYRVQKISSSYYCFRKHTESTLENDFYPYYHRIQSLKKWDELKPMAVEVDILGEISKKQ